MTIYLTFNDSPSGVYSSQVIDVVKYLNETTGEKTRLVSFISIRSFLKDRRKIRRELPGAIVLPMVPKVKNWLKNRWMLKLVTIALKPDRIIGRGPFACFLAKKTGNGARIIYDGRGAYSAELHEYDVVAEEEIKKQVHFLEQEAVLNSDFRIAVSYELVKYWRDQFSYTNNNHVVIPCTLNRSFFESDERNELRKKLDWKSEDVVMVYSGSTAGWQSFEALDRFLLEAFATNPRLKFLLLANSELKNFKAYSAFPERMKQMWLAPGEVRSVLADCDYGILLREKSVTNQVASPTKFAEYLSVGLKVIISEGIGDFSHFVREHQAGQVYSDGFDFLKLEESAEEEKVRMKKLALEHFTKSVYEEAYRKIRSI